MERIQLVFSGIFGFHLALVLYYVARFSNDVLLHSLIFTSGVLGVLLFSLSKIAFENRVCFLVTLLMIITTFLSSLHLASVFPGVGGIFRWMIMVLYNIASTRSMRLVDIQKVASRNIIINTLILILNITYQVIE